KNGIAIEYTNIACPAENRNSVSNSFFGLFLSIKFSPVYFDIKDAKYTILPVPINIAQTDTKSEKKMPTMPIIAQIIIPAKRVAKNFWLMNSIRCSSSVLFFIDECDGNCFRFFLPQNLHAFTNDIDGLVYFLFGND